MAASGGCHDNYDITNNYCKQLINPGRGFKGWNWKEASTKGPAITYTYGWKIVLKTRYNNR